MSGKPVAYTDFGNSNCYEYFHISNVFVKEDFADLYEKLKLIKRQ